MTLASNATLLDVVGLRKAFGALVAVDDVSFSLRAGEILGIAGPNGAGKTTMFNLITGIPFRPDRGVVTLGGTRIDRLPPHRIFRLGLARTFQKETTFAELTVEQNVRLGAVYGAALRGRELVQRVDATLDRLDLTERRQHPAAALTVYESKRLMLASAVVTKPRLLMLDEPASGLTSAEVADLQRVILDIRRDGAAILLIEHILPLLFGLSERVMVMDFGRKLTEGSPAAVARDERVIEAYLGGQSQGATDALAG